MIGLSIFSCEDVPVFNEDQQTPVVEAFLYTGEQVDDVKLTELIPFGNDEEDIPPINDAQVSLIYAESSYQLEPSPGDSGYYHYPGDDLVIKPGETYNLEVLANGVAIHAETVVPEAPSGVVISQDTIEIPPIYSFEDLRNIRETFQETIDISWENDTGEYYYVLIENMEENPQSIDVNETLPFRFSFVSRPTTDDFFSLRIFAHYTQYGLHRARIFKVNQEYADLYESSEQDSRNLNEPLSNVNNGLGIFTAFTSTDIYFEVKQP